MINRRNKDLTGDDVALIAQTYSAGRNKNGRYQDKAGFCKSAAIDESRSEKNCYPLKLGRYVGTEEEVDDGVPFQEKMSALTIKLSEPFTESSEPETTIRSNLKSIGYEF